MAEKKLRAPTDRELDVLARQAAINLHNLIEIKEQTKLRRGRTKSDRGQVTRQPSRPLRLVGETIGLLHPSEETWRDHALCKTANGDWVTIEKMSAARQLVEKRAEIALCGICPVREECLDYAIARNEPDGIWGGLLPKDRRERGQVDVRCGTVAGYSRHRRRKEQICDPCRLAWNAALVERKRRARKKI